jgi:hypothetical protein
MAPIREGGFCTICRRLLNSRRARARVAPAGNPLSCPRLCGQFPHSRPHARGCPGLPVYAYSRRNATCRLLSHAVATDVRRSPNGRSRAKAGTTLCEPSFAPGEQWVGVSEQPSRVSRLLIAPAQANSRETAEPYRGSGARTLGDGPMEATVVPVSRQPALWHGPYLRLESETAGTRTQDHLLKGRCSTDWATISSAPAQARADAGS